MLYWIIQTTILSIIFIFVVHYLINFFKSTLTVPKIKDLINSPTQKYENIYNIISKNESNNMVDSTNISDLNNIIHAVDNNLDFKIEYADAKPDTESMKNELKSFLKKQMNSTTTNVSGLDAYSNSSNMNSYMTF
jgi:hypothetical protein